MRLRITCMECFRVDGKPSEEAASVEMRDDGLYTVACSRGHTSITAIQQQKFEILFDLGAMALLDGYPREAVSSIASSLERFYEYYIQVICLQHGIAHESFLEAWKSLSRQSERQLGAFLFLYLLENKKPLNPLILDAKPKSESGPPGITWTEFRNNVIHKGYLPSSEEVIVYGNLVYQFIYRLISELRVANSDSMGKATFHHLKKGIDAKSQTPMATMSIPTLISLVRAEAPPQTFREALKGLEKYKRWLYHHDTQPN